MLHEREGWTDPTKYLSAWESRAAEASVSDMVTELHTTLVSRAGNNVGMRIIAFATNDDERAVQSWADGAGEPTPVQEAQLRLLYRVTGLIASAAPAEDALFFLTRMAPVYNVYGGYVSPDAHVSNEYLSPLSAIKVWSGEADHMSAELKNAVDVYLDGMGVFSLYGPRTDYAWLAEVASKGLLAEPGRRHPAAVAEEARRTGNPEGAVETAAAQSAAAGAPPLPAGARAAAAGTARVQGDAGGPRSTSDYR